MTRPQIETQVKDFSDKGFTLKHEDGSLTRITAYNIATIYAKKVEKNVNAVPEGDEGMMSANVTRA